MAVQYTRYIFVCGNGGNFWYSDDNGTTWNQITTGLSDAIVSIWGLTPTDIYLGTTYGQIYHYDGDSVTLENELTYHSSSNVVCDIHGNADGSEIWVSIYRGGAPSTVFCAVKSGGSWTEYESGNIYTTAEVVGGIGYSNIVSLHCDASGNYYIFDPRTSTSLYSLFNETTFHMVPVGIRETSTDVVFVVGPNTGINKYGKVYRGDGTSWSLEYTATQHAAFRQTHADSGNQLWISPTDQIWIAGEGYITQYDGASWTENVQTGYWTDVHGLDDSNVWFVRNDVTSSHLIRWNGSSFDSAITIDNFNPWGVWTYQKISTVDDDLASGTGKNRRLFLKIDGLEPILWDNAYENPPSDWTRTTLRCLNAPKEFSATMDLQEMRVGLSAMTLVLDDIADTDGKSYFGKLFAPARWDTAAVTYLAPGEDTYAKLDADATSIPCKSISSGFGSSGTAYIGQETFSYTGKLSLSRTDGVTSAPATRQFTSAGSAWYGLIAAGDILVLVGNNGDANYQMWAYRIASVIDNSNLTVATDWLQGNNTGLTWAIAKFTGVTKGLYPCIGGNYGYEYKRPMPSDSTVNQSISTYPFSWVGRRVALYVTTFNELTGAINYEGAEKLIWAGRINNEQGSIIQDGRTRQWKLGCKDILQDLDREIMNDAPSVTLARRINLVGRSDCRSFQIRADDNVSGFVYTTITASSGSYILQDLCTELNDQVASAVWYNSGDSTINADILVSFTVSDASNGNIQIRASSVGNTTVYLNPIGTCHLFNALGLEPNKTTEISLTESLNQTIISASTDDFSVDGNAVTLTSGSYDFVSLIYHIEDSIRALGGEYAAFRISYSSALRTMKWYFTTVTAITWTDSALQTLLGFSGSQTGASSYASTGVGSEGTYYYTGFKDVTAYVGYQPLHSLFNNYYLYLNNIVKLWQDQGDFETAKAWLMIEDCKENFSGDKYTWIRAYESVSTTYVALYPGDEADKVSLEGYVAFKADDESIDVKQIYVPTVRHTANSVSFDGPFELLLYTLLSSGTDSYNHATYDKLPRECGLNMQDDLVDTQSFLDADASVMGMLAWRNFYPIIEPTTWLDLIQRECKLFGYALCWKDGQISLTDIRSPSIRRADVTISDSSHASLVEYPDLTQSVGTVVNQWDISYGLDFFRSGKYAYNLVITDVDSANGLSVIKQVEIEHPGIYVIWFPGVNYKNFFENLLLGGLTRYPMPIVDVSLSGVYLNRIFAGDIVYFTSSFLNDPLGTGDRGIENYATVLQVSWDYRAWAGKATLLIHTFVQKRGLAWAPAACVDDTAANNGWDAGSKLLTLYANIWSASGGNHDGERFACSDKIKIIERAPQDPSSPQYWTATVHSTTPYNTSTRQLALDAGTTLTGWDTTKRYIITYDDYSAVQASQKTDGVWLADPITTLLNDTDNAMRYK